jgi:hypothetical protein
LVLKLVVFFDPLVLLLVFFFLNLHEGRTILSLHLLITLFPFHSIVAPISTFADEINECLVLGRKMREKMPWRRAIEKTSSNGKKVEPSQQKMVTKITGA